MDLNEIDYDLGLFLESAPESLLSRPIQSGSAAEGPSPKREVKGARRVRNACLQCRKRKIRCSRTYPCKIISDILITKSIYICFCAYVRAFPQAKDVSPEGMARHVIGKAAFRREFLSSMPHTIRPVDSLSLFSKSKVLFLFFRFFSVIVVI